MFLRHIQTAEFDSVACARWMETTVLRQLFYNALPTILHRYGFMINQKYDAIIEEHWNGLEFDGALFTEGDEYTGEHRYLDINKKDAYCRNFLSSNIINNRMNTLGEDAILRALAVIARQEGWTSQDADRGFDQADRDSSMIADQAPASDRVVMFSDNEVGDFDRQTSEVIEAIAAQNHVENSPGMRELILGQLRAGRELIRSGSFKLYLLQLTLIDTLHFLASRYEHDAIGGLAKSLISALIKHLGMEP